MGHMRDISPIERIGALEITDGIPSAVQTLRSLTEILQTLVEVRYGSSQLGQGAGGLGFLHLLWAATMR